jgi:molybdopterin-guanine dinucleotide biosynthesis adapter protein
MNREPGTPVLGFAAYSGTGKTTLLVKLLPMLKARGLRVGVIKHAHHTFEIDHPGKDSYELRHAGATQMLIGSRHRWALVVETGDEPPLSLADHIRRMDHDNLDLILVEGFKPEVIPKIELHRPSLRKPLLFPNDRGIIAIASDAPLSVTTDLPLLDLNTPEQLRDFITERFIPAAGDHEALSSES